MTKWIALPAAFVAAAALALNVEAAPKTNGQANSPKTTKTTTKGPSTKGSSSTTKGPSTKSAGSTKAKGPKSTTTTTAKGNGSSKKSGSTATASTSTGSTATNPTTTTTTDWKPTNAVAEKLMTKPNQLAKLKAALGDSTIDINDATAGFKNFGQLNAAVNVSQNLGIDFADLKTAMTGITLEGTKTNEPTKSLGQAIQQFKPGVNAEAEAAAATAQATREGGQ
jgi:hypothetical protein